MFQFVVSRSHYMSKQWIGYQYLFLPPKASSPLLLEPLAPPPEPRGFSYPIPPAIPELEYFGMLPKLY